MLLEEKCIEREDNLCEKKDTTGSKDETFSSLSSFENNVLDNNVSQNKNNIDLIKSNQSICSFKGCKKKPVRIIGDCKYCESKYCNNHRLPETHFCCNYIDVKNNSKKILENKIMNEKCIGEKLQNRF